METEELNNNEQAGKDATETEQPDDWAQGPTPGTVPPAPSAYHIPPPYPPIGSRIRSDKPSIAGGLLVVAAVLGIITGVLMIGGGAFLEDLDIMDIGGWDSTDIYGVVHDDTGAPVDNATISILDTHHITHTNATGHYIIHGAPTGFQDIQVEKTGYNTIVFTAFIGEEGRTYDGPRDVDVKTDGEYNFNLTPGSDTIRTGMDEEIFGFFEKVLITGGVVVIICSALALIGGISALRRERFYLAVIGAVAGIFAIGFCFGSLFSIIALLLLLLSSNEFKRPEQEAM